MNFTNNTVKTAIMTICSNNYFPIARVLLSSLRRYHPECTLFLGLADIQHPAISLGVEGVEIIEARSLNIPNFLDFAFRYNILEFNTAIKPFMMSFLIEEMGFDQVIYIDPDIELFSPMTNVFKTLKAGANFVITPHFASPTSVANLATDINEISALKYGIYNLGFIAVNNSPDVITFLHWWRRRLRFQCLNQYQEGLYVDQKFIDLLPGFFDNVAILRDTNVNVAYWNLAQRKLEQIDGQWFIDGRPLVFFHFSQIDLKNADCLSKHSEAFSKNLEPALYNLVLHYLQQIKDLEVNSQEYPYYVYGYFSNGVIIPNSVRIIYQNLDTPWLENPFETFAAFLNEPHKPDLVPSWPLTKLMYLVWQQRQELKDHYDLTTEDGKRNYVFWFIQNSSKLKLSELFLEPILKQIPERIKSFYLSHSLN